MSTNPSLQTPLRWLAGGAALTAAGYAAYVAFTWSRYGKPPRGRPEEHDALFDRFMPTFDIVERHHVAVKAPADVTLSAARRMDLASSAVVRAIFRGRELLLGSKAEPRGARKGLIDELLTLGWGILAEIPGREIVVGAVTKPWEPNVTFRPLAPDAFAAFAEPGYVKIAWTLRADPTSATTSVFRTETRAIATDAFAHDKFRWYWSCLSPGIFIIRRMMLGPVKREAEQIWLNPAAPRIDREESLPGIEAQRQLAITELGDQPLG
jgi:hypothetical protein